MSIVQQIPRQKRYLHSKFIREQLMESPDFKIWCLEESPLSYLVTWETKRMASMFGRTACLDQHLPQLIGKYNFYDMEPETEAHFLERFGEFVDEGYRRVEQRLYVHSATQPMSPPAKSSIQIHTIIEGVAKTYEAQTANGLVLGQVKVEPVMRGTYLISDLLVQNEYRKKGIGRWLMQQAMIREGGTAFLHVQKDNKAAIALYEQLGFEYKYNCTNYVLR